MSCDWKTAVACPVAVKGDPKEAANYCPVSLASVVLGQAPPLQLSFDTGSPGNSIQITNVVKDLVVFMDSSFRLPLIARFMKSHTSLFGILVDQTGQ